LASDDVDEADLVQTWAQQVFYHPLERLLGEVAVVYRKENPLSCYFPLTSITHVA
jgi:hypothetical protein